MENEKKTGRTGNDLFTPEVNQLNEKEGVRMQRETEGGPTTGHRHRGEEEGRAKARGKEKRVTTSAGGRAAGDEKKAAGGRGGVSLTGGRGEAKPVYVRLPEAMVKAIDEAVSDSPIEFGSASDFIRRAIETELRRRGKVAQFK